ncbi:hypothetical protein GCM10007423_54520 [Dyadobacter endophyticus]|uniref:Fe2OG dioxygenase domain-containing protein n=1 Tax=Dyadobacter endophyticus TaxID=1749036 RepID=A0ABQ1Z5N9_9BACT|nr:2OG-Fe(II) oxygenase [Dyadobacter endophyticus]GGH51255.1 hypothetical protein GCM10007423_54520 [Dyadobacter endophyticus]
MSNKTEILHTAGTVRCIDRLFNILQIKIPQAAVKSAFAQYDNYPNISLSEIIDAFRSWNIYSMAIKVKGDSLASLDPPILIYLEEDVENTSFAVLTDFSEEIVCYYHPNKGIVTESRDDLFKRWKGVALLIDGSNSVVDPLFDTGTALVASEVECYLKSKFRVIDGFLDPTDCDAIISHAEERMGRSEIVVNGANVLSNHRTSYSASLVDLPEELNSKIRSRVKGLLGDLCYGSIENLQCVSYSNGQQFKTHFDVDKDLRRLYTILVYLNDDFMGGHTFFPELDVSVTPKLGRAVLFHNFDSNGDIDRFSLHAGLPITNGIKYACNIWIRE